MPSASHCPGEMARVSFLWGQWFREHQWSVVIYPGHSALFPVSHQSFWNVQVKAGHTPTFQSWIDTSMPTAALRLIVSLTSCRRLADFTQFREHPGSKGKKGTLWQASALKVVISRIPPNTALKLQIICISSRLPCPSGIIRMKSDHKTNIPWPGSY